FPAEAADERYELGASAVFDLHARAGARHACESLISGGADRNDELARARELLHERLRYRRRGSGDDDAIERRLIRPAVSAVEYFHRRVVDLQFANELGGAKRE